MREPNRHGELGRHVPDLGRQDRGAEVCFPHGEAELDWRVGAGWGDVRGDVGGWEGEDLGDGGGEGGGGSGLFCELV